MKKKIFATVIVVLFCFPLFGGCATMDIKKQDIIREISFSPDGKKIIFDRRNAGNSNRVHVYNLETGELAAYQPPKGEKWFHAQYSFDGKRIVFIVSAEDDPLNPQIAIMNLDGKNVRKITNTQGLKFSPSFSHSGKKIIFARPDVIRTSGKTPAADFDVYEVDVETGRETRLTYFKFFSVSAPYYFPDDKTFVFYGDFPRAYPAIPGSDRSIDIMKKVRKELEFKYKNNFIYVMQANEKELKPYLVMPEYVKKYKMYVASSESSRSPSLSADGSVLIFISIGYKPDGSAMGEQLYQYSVDGNHRQITHLPMGLIWSQTVSPNGELVAIVRGGQATNKIVICKIKDGTTREIILPVEPSRIINAQ
ncbi:MAG: PD40 domain-containing protein [Syntrophaceae bacterium]|nr:PD40 domain-containing protein [Syntrophaceae bacterium]